MMIKSQPPQLGIRNNPLRSERLVFIMTVMTLPTGKRSFFMLCGWCVLVDHSSRPQIDSTLVSNFGTACHEFVEQQKWQGGLPVYWILGCLLIDPNVHGMKEAETS